MSILFSFFAHSYYLLYLSRANALSPKKRTRMHSCLCYCVFWMIQVVISTTPGECLWVRHHITGLRIHCQQTSNIALPTPMPYHLWSPDGLPLLTLHQFPNWLMPGTVCCCSSLNLLYLPLGDTLCSKNINSNV